MTKMSKSDYEYKHEEMLLQNKSNIDVKVLKCKDKQHRKNQASVQKGVSSEQYKNRAS